MNLRQYKPRFECMEQCYASYTALSPHHSLARYCIQVSVAYDLVWVGGWVVANHWWVGLVFWFQKSS